MIKGEKLDPYYWIPFELVTPATLQKYVDKE
jgi:inositol transport system substrate-binding protein